MSFKKVDSRLRGNDREEDSSVYAVFQWGLTPLKKGIKSGISGCRFEH
jgi:hypothetical protein